MQVNWTSLLYKFGMRRNSYEAAAELTKAYQNVFLSGGASEEQRELVLSDLLRVSGFQRITGPGQTDRDLWYAEGRRSLYAHIFGYLRFDDQHLRALEEAALREAAAEQSQSSQ